MTISQLCAIKYSYTRKEKQAAERAAQEKGVDLVFNWQTVYKTIKGFVNSTDEKKLTRAYKEARKNIEARKKQLEASRCTSTKYTDCLKALEQVDTLLLKALINKEKELKK